MRLGMITGQIDKPYLPERTMVFTGRQTPETHGELLSWTSLPGDVQTMIRKQELGPGLGLPVLEAQERLYRFLVDCCKSLLHEIPQTELENQEVEVLPEPPSISGNEIGFKSLATTAAEAPYWVPANYDFT